MSIIKYNSSATSSASTASSGVAVGGGVTMEQISDAFLPAQPTDEEKTKYDVEVEGTFKKNVTLPSITLKSADGTKTATISLNDNGKLNVNKSIYLPYTTYLDMQGRQDDGYVNAIRAYDYDNNQLTHIIGLHGSNNTYKWIYVGGKYDSAWLKVTEEQVETKGNKFKIGEAPLIEWDSTNNAFKFNAPIYSTGDVVAFGTSGSDIQTVQEMIVDYINEHKSEFGSIDNVVIATATGDGNVITGMSAALSTDKRTITITPTKGITALTEHQNIDGKVNKSGDTMTGALKFGNANHSISGATDMVISANGGWMYILAKNKIYSKVGDNGKSFQIASDSLTWDSKNIAVTDDITNAINALDVTDTAVANQFVTAVSEADGKITVSRASLTASNIAQAGKLSNATSGNADTATTAEKVQKESHSSANTYYVNFSSTASSKMGYNTNLSYVPSTGTLSATILHLNGSMSATSGSFSNKVTLAGLDANTAILAFSRKVADGDAYGINYITYPTAGYLAIATANNSNSIVGLFDTGSFRPYTNNTRTLGTSSYKWNAVYATTIYGALSGNASTATTAEKVQKESHSSSTKYYVNFSSSSASKLGYNTSFTYTPSTNTVEANLKGNATTATTLATPRTIWGQTFDGSGDVNGYVIINNDYGVEGKDTGGTARTLLTLNASNQVNLAYGTAGAGYDTYVNGNNTIFRQGTSHSEKMRITSGGNIGIGTTAPEYKLDVIGEIRSKVTTGAARLRANYNGTNEIRMYADSAIVGMWGQNDAPMVFATNNNERMRLTSDGKLGIGTTSPQQKLHISGAARTKYVDFYSKDGEANRAGWVGRGSDANDNLTLYSDNAAINIDSNAEINLKGVHKQVVKVAYNANASQSYACIGEAGTNCKVSNLNFSVNGYDSLARLQFLDNGNFYIGRNYETTISNDNAAVRIASTGGLVLSSTAALSGVTRDNAIYIRPSGSNSGTNQAKFESTGVSINASSANCLVIKRTDGSYGAFVNYKAKNQDAIYWQVGSSSEHKFTFNYTSSTGSTITSKVTIDSNGNIVANGDVTAYSDARLKSEIKDLEFRGALNPKTYIKDGKQCIGFIAQEVRELYPELVIGEESENEFLSLNYGAITAVLAAENKELHKKVESLEDRISKLETLINKLIEK